VCRDEVEAGRLVQLLPEWTAPFGTIHMVFGTRRGLLPAVRALIDHIVAEYAVVMTECVEARAALAAAPDNLRDKWLTRV